MVQISIFTRESSTKIKNSQELVALFLNVGRLVEPYGEYHGQFLHGEKHGTGKYTFSSQLVYEGEYNRGQREGKGRLINKDGSLSY
jgi:hypothetical protein